VPRLRATQYQEVEARLAAGQDAGRGDVRRGIAAPGSTPSSAVASASVPVLRGPVTITSKEVGHAGQLERRAVRVRRSTPSATFLPAARSSRIQATAPGQRPHVAIAEVGRDRLQPDHHGVEALGVDPRPEGIDGPWRSGAVCRSRRVVGVTATSLSLGHRPIPSTTAATRMTPQPIVTRLQEAKLCFVVVGALVGGAQRGA